MVRKEHWTDPKFQQACIVATRLANQTGQDHRIFKAYGNYCVRLASAEYDGEHLCIVRQSHFEDDIERRERVDYTWQSTPALWAATRHDYDGAPDAKCPIGFGKTKDAAFADLVAKEVE